MNLQKLDFVKCGKSPRCYKRSALQVGTVAQQCLGGLQELGGAVPQPGTLRAVQLEHLKWAIDET